MDEQAVQAAARHLAQARERGEAIGPLPAGLQPASEANGYAVQAALHALQAAEAGRVHAGWKLGCTTPVMQALVGVPGATYGGMAQAGLHTGDTHLAHATFRRPGVECEIALRLGRDLPPAGAPYEAAGLAGAVEAAMVAAEVVDDRYTDFRALGAPLLIADDFFHAAAVLGEPVPPQGLDLAALEGVTTVDGAEAGRGHGRDALGHPLAALAWLANTLAAGGRGLAAGEMVLTGSVVATQWVGAGTAVTVHVERLGRLTLRFD